MTPFRILGRNAGWPKPITRPAEPLPIHGERHVEPAPWPCPESEARELLSKVTHDWRGTSALATCSRCHATRLGHGVPGDGRIRYIRPDGGKAILREPPCEVVP